MLESKIKQDSLAKGPKVEKHEMSNLKSWLKLGSDLLSKNYEELNA